MNFAQKCECFKIDNTTSVSVIINDKHLRLRLRCFSVNNHFNIGYYPLHKAFVYKQKDDLWVCAGMHDLLPYHAAGTSINVAFCEEIINSDISFIMVIMVVYEKIFGSINNRFSNSHVHCRNL